jgi:hypothetical protein
MESKCIKNAENVYAPFVMVSIGARKRTLAGNTVYKNGSIDTSFYPPLFSFENTFRSYKSGAFFRKAACKLLTVCVL